MKVSKFSWNCFKLFIIVWISLCWQKNLVWISHGTPYCFYRVSKILAVYPSWIFSVVSLLIWELIILNQNHLKLCTHHRISLSRWENYVWASCDSVERGSWSSLMVLTLTTLFYLFQFIKVFKFSRNRFKLFTNDRICLIWGKNIVWISHGTPYWFYRVCNISSIYPSWASCVVSFSIWELIILNQNHLNLCRHHRISALWWESYVCATFDSVDRCSWSSPMVLTFFDVAQFMKACKFSLNRLKIFTNDQISLDLGKNIGWFSHGTP